MTEPPPTAETVSVGGFFDALSGQYADFVERCVPWYREMSQALFDSLPPERPDCRVLELGCGTGNLSLLLRRMFPAASLTLVDVSGQSLEICRQRVGSDADVRYLERDFRDLDFPNAAFDLVVSTIAIHHLNSEEKQHLFRSVNDWLTREGVFAFADQCRGVTDDLNARFLQRWRERSLAAGAEEDEWRMWMQHQADHDFHDSLPDQLAWLSAAGFPVVDCTWRYLLWCVIQARMA